jgi:outer membrane protein TolC
MAGGNLMAVSGRRHRLGLGWLGPALLAIVASGAAGAQERPAISLAEAIQRATRVQPGVVQAIGTLTSADARARSAWGAYLPSLNFSTSGNNSYSEGAARTTPDGRLVSGTSNSVTGSVNSSIELFDGFRRSSESRAARANRESASESLDNARFQVTLITTNQFFDVLAAQQLVRVRDAGVRRAEEQLKVSIARLRAGAAIRSDSLRSLVTLGNARVQLVNAGTQLATAEANLGRLVGADSRVAALDDSSFYRVVTDVDPAALRIEATSRSPQVRAAEASARSAQAAVGVARAGYWPTITLNGSASLNGAQRLDTTVASRSSFGFQSARQFTLQLNWGVFNRFQREQNIATQLANADAAEATAGEARRLVLANLTTRLAELEAAAVRIGITQTSLTAATEDLRVQQERYRLGVATIVDVLTSQEALTQAEVDAVTARFDYLRAKAQIETLIGRTL